MIRLASSFSGRTSDSERESALEATAQPQDEDVVELGEDVLRISSGDGPRGAVARHPLQVRQRKSQAAECRNRAIRAAGDSEANR